MLTSFLEKSRPINFVILILCMFLIFILQLIATENSTLDWATLLNHILQFSACIFILFILDFIVNKNKLTEHNTFAVFFFTGFLLMFPEIFLHSRIIFANLFLMLAFRRIISLNKDTNSAQKILDSGIWISVASLFYFWSFLFFIPLIFAIFFKPNTNYKQMLMPFVGVVMVLLIVIAYELLAHNSLAAFTASNKTIGLNFSVYNDVKILLPTTIFLGFFIWTGISRISKYKTLPFTERSQQIVLFYIALTGVLIALAAPEKTSAELLFVLPPVSIIAANYFEKDTRIQMGTDDKWEKLFKELLLWLIPVFVIIFMAL